MTTRHRKSNEELTVGSMREDYEYWNPMCITCRKRKARGEFSNSTHADGAQCNVCSANRTTIRFLRTVADTPEWMDHPYKGCSSKALAEEGVSPDVFFPETPADRAEARWEPICAACPVRDLCLAYGRETPSQGVWGGVYIPPREPVAAVSSPSPLQGRVTLDNVPPELLRGPRIQKFLEEGKCNKGHVITKDDIRLSWRKSQGRYYASCRFCKAGEDSTRDRSKSGSNTILAS